MAYYNDIQAQHQNNRNNKYRKKHKHLIRHIKGLLIENAALCDEVAKIQESILIVKEERRFLLRKLLEYETNPEVPQTGFKNLPPGFVLSNGSHQKIKKGRSPDSSNRIFSGS